MNRLTLAQRVAAAFDIPCRWENQSSANGPGVWSFYDERIDWQFWFESRRGCLSLQIDGAVGNSFYRFRPYVQVDLEARNATRNRATVAMLSHMARTICVLGFDEQRREIFPDVTISAVEQLELQLAFRERCKQLENSI